jgi:hypothetical protein
MDFGREKIFTVDGVVKVCQGLVGTERPSLEIVDQLRAKLIPPKNEMIFFFLF